MGVVNYVQVCVLFSNADGRLCFVFICYVSYATALLHVRELEEAKENTHRMLLESQNILASLRAEKEGSEKSDSNDAALEKRSKTPVPKKSKPTGKKATAVEILQSLTPYQVQYDTSHC